MYSCMEPREVGDSGEAGRTSLARANGLVDLTSDGGGGRSQVGGWWRRRKRGGVECGKGAASGDGEADLVDDRFMDLLQAPHSSKAHLRRIWRFVKILQSVANDVCLAISTI